MSGAGDSEHRRLKTGRIHPGGTTITDKKGDASQLVARQKLYYWQQQQPQQQSLWVRSSGNEKGQSKSEGVMVAWVHGQGHHWQGRAPKTSGTAYHHAIRKGGGLSITTARAQQQLSIAEARAQKQPCVCVHPESTRGHPPTTDNLGGIWSKLIHWDLMEQRKVVVSVLISYFVSLTFMNQKSIFNFQISHISTFTPSFAHPNSLRLPSPIKSSSVAQHWIFDLLLHLRWLIFKR